MSSAANALLWNIAEGKQCNLLSYFSAHTRPPQRLNRAPRKQGSQNREVATAAFRTTRTAGQTLPATAPKHAGMALRTLRYLPGGWAQGARAGAHLTVSPRASVEGARRVLQRRKARAAEALRRRGAR
jgi:hypothetical protein